jgi:hypothetical protein
MMHLTQIAAHEHVADLRRAAERDRVAAAARARSRRPGRLRKIVEHFGSVSSRPARRRSWRSAPQDRISCSG